MPYDGTSSPPANGAPRVVELGELGAADLALAGGKGANLGELTRAGFPVPPGFCVTTDAYRTFLTSAPEAGAALDELAALPPNDTGGARAAGERLRTALEAAPMPAGLAREIEAAWRRAGAEHAYAVRSSATAEDLPGASFAGQQDTYLNVRGRGALLDAVRRCWASLFTERAILYRARNGFDHREVALAVVVQRMVDADVAGILFTADPVSGDRRTAVIDAGFGLGEALVSGVVSADRFRVDRRTGTIEERHVADKREKIAPAAGGGVERRALREGERGAASLDDHRVLELAALGGRIEAHFKTPQDIEWAYADGALVALQARPITSLYPLPEPRPTDGGLHVYFSFAHAQGLLEPMSPMGLSLWRLMLPFGRPGDAENPYLPIAGGRMYLDLSSPLRNPLGRRVIPTVLANAEPLAPDALRALASQPDFQRHGERTGWGAMRRTFAPLAFGALAWLAWRRLGRAPGAAQRSVTTFLEAADARLAAATGAAAKVRASRAVLTSVFVEGAWKLAPFIAGGIVGYHLLRRWAPAGREHDVAAVARGLAYNVTTEMDLQVGDLADAARDHPEVAAALTEPDASAGERLASVDGLPGGAAFRSAFTAFLDRYGMRGPAEIDIARPRWRDDPTSLLGMLRVNLLHDHEGSHRAHRAHRAHHAALARAGDEAASRLARSARRGPWGWLRGPVVARLARVARTLPALREHPKFLLVHTLDRVRPILLEAGRSLTDLGRLERPEDVWWLTFPELQAAVEGAGPPAGPAAGVPVPPAGHLRATVARRKRDQERYARMAPPRLMTSDGLVLTLKRRTHDLPAGALAGSAVSPGVAEGRARVVLDPGQADLQPGEILVAPFTDPGWTPLFTQAAGLVMEVGGLMTHGSVVAREYGLPAVVGVEGATTRIVTGQRVRVHGDEGYVELIEDAERTNERPGGSDTMRSGARSGS